MPAELPTTDADLGFTPGYELRQLIATKQLSPVELTESHLRRADELDPKFGIFITRISDLAIDAAREAEAAVMRGDELGPLHGIPVPVKDTEPMNGVTWTHGSLPHRNNIADRDSIPVRRIKAAGAIITGKTNTPENGYAGTTENLIGPPARNPWNPDCTPGGSSGGSASAVACGLAHYAPGGDGGGSIRIPAGFSGIYGIKPTQGRVPRGAVSKESFNIMNNSTFGPLTRTVRDSAIALQLAAGPAPDNEYGIIQDTPPDFEAALSRGVKGLKIGWSNDLGGNPVDPEVVTVAELLVRVFEELGAVVEDVDFRPTDYADIFWTWFDYFSIKGLSTYRDDFDHHRDDLTGYFGEYLDRANTLPAERMWNIFSEIGQYRDYTNRFFEGYDLLLSPSLAVPAFKIGEEPEVIGGKSVPHRLWGFTPFTYLFNLTGNPGASVPAGFSNGGLPIGLQIIGDMQAEETVLAASAALEEARPWADKRPLVS
jgi:aspartyl-tRNA(Asn)/glutamyl-tRNA(Gln) amidotransferase subunit A